MLDLEEISRFLILDMTELENLREVLENTGIGAELHAHLRKKIVEILQGEIKTKEKTAENQIIISAIAEFFTAENLEFSKSVLAAEAGFDFLEISKIKKDFCLTTEDSVLVQLFKKFPGRKFNEASTQTIPDKIRTPLDSSINSSF